MNLLMTFILSLGVLAANDSKKLDQGTAFLRSKTVQRIDVEKTVHFELQGKTLKSKGQIFVGSGKFRWETTEPEKSLILFDGKTLWTRQDSPAELGGDVQITKSNLGKEAKNQLLVKLLAEKTKISEKFKILKADKEEKGTRYSLEPRKEDPSIKKFSLVIGGKTSTLKEISYTDEIGNVTTLEIVKKENVKKANKKIFEMEVPKGAQVNEL